MRAPEFIDSLPVANTLGEGVLWHPAREEVWWTDIHACKLYRYTPASKALESWSTPERLTAFGFIEHSDQLIASFDRGLAFYTPQTGELHWLSHPEAHLPNNRFNDGKVDHQGRFWAGSMVERGEPDSINGPAGVNEQAGLYCWGGATGCVKHLAGLRIVNGLSWSPDSRVAYVSDTARSCYYAYDFDVHSGSLSNRRLFARTPKGTGPDGACVDAEGNVWSAQHGGGKVVCYSPQGKTLLQLNVPVTNPTCLAFGGPDLSWLLVTTAREHLSEAQLAQEPEAGNLLIYQTDTRGLSADYFRG